MQRVTIAATAIVALLGVTTLGTAQAPDGKMRVNAEWFDLIFRGPRQDNAPAPRPRLKRPKRTGWNYEWTGGTYRTLCVRLCDGFSFPISYSTLRERFAADAKQCEQRCPSRSRLFVHRNPGEDVDDMVDLDGRRYRNLPLHSCTKLNTSRIAPVAATLGMRRHLPGIARTLKWPRRRWLQGSRLDLH